MFWEKFRDLLNSIYLSEVSTAWTVPVVPFNISIKKWDCFWSIFRYGSSSFFAIKFLEELYRVRILRTYLSLGSDNKFVSCFALILLSEIFGVITSGRFTFYSSRISYQCQCYVLIFTDSTIFTKISFKSNLKNALDSLLSQIYSFILSLNPAVLTKYWFISCLSSKKMFWDFMMYLEIVDFIPFFIYNFKYSARIKKS